MNWKTILKRYNSDRLGLTSNITRKMENECGGVERCRQICKGINKYLDKPLCDGYHYDYNNMGGIIKCIIYSCRDRAEPLGRDELQKLKKKIEYVLEDVTLFFTREIEKEPDTKEELMLFYNKLEKYLNDIYEMRKLVESDLH